MSEKPTVEGKEGKLIPFNGSYLTLSHYKEPLKEVKKGFGYYGALCSTQEGDKVQCHVCGELFTHLPSHTAQAHKMSASDYREEFQLAKSTALCSEEYRTKLKKAYIKRMNAMSKSERLELLKRMRERIKEGRNKVRDWSHPITLETKNKRGVCPDQLLDKIRKVAQVLGRTPSKIEFITECGTQRYIHLIYKTFGSWKNALKILNMTPKIQTYPTKKKRYSDEELLEYLAIFAQENNKVPTYTDFKAGLLPEYSIYTRRFGSIDYARQLAGVYNFVDDPVLKTGYAAKSKEVQL